MVKAAKSSSPAPLDLAIIGSGPAALTAALYAARAGLAVTVFERANIGGALAEISKISNFPGFTGAGPELAAALKQQAVAAGAQVVYGDCSAVVPVSAASSAPVAASAPVALAAASAVSVPVTASAASSAQPPAFTLTIDGAPVLARAVLFATGSEPRPLACSLDRPISYCALCDGDLIRGRHVAVVGGANSALQEALYLADLAADVTIISHSPLRADHVLQERVAAAPNISVRANTEAAPDLLNAFDHVFVFIGKRPASAPLASLAAANMGLLDPEGYILTAPVASAASAAPSSQTAAPGLKTAAPSPKTTTSAAPSHQTVIPGLFAAGDVRSGAVRQAITAAADGAAAAIEIANFLKTTA